MEFIIFLAIIGFIVAVISELFGLRAVSKLKKAAKKVLKNDGFEVLDFHLGYSEGYRHMIAVNKDQNSIALLEIDEYKKTFSYKKKIVKKEIISYKDIMGVEVYHDGKIITQTKRLSQIGGMVVGNALLGIPGMIIGGLSGKTEQHDKKNIKHIQLVIYVNDVSNPIRKVDFLNSLSGSFISKHTLEIAEKWTRIIEILIKKADQDMEKEKSEKGSDGLAIENNIIGSKEKEERKIENVLEQLEKLNKLKQTNAISEDEFIMLKEDILKNK